MPTNQLANSELYPTLSQSIFINNFQGGASQSPNLGMGALVGFDAYTKPGAVILGRAISTTYPFAGGLSLPEYPVYMAISNNQTNVIGSRIWVQTYAGTVYYSDNYGSTWNNVTGAPNSGGGRGMIVFQNYLFAFDSTRIFYATADAVSPTFTSWKTAIDNNTTPTSTSPLSSNHFPFIFPNGRGFYFANNNAVGFIGQVFPVGATLPTTFDPAGTINTNYVYLPTILTLPQNYCVNVLDFLAPSSLVIGANNIWSGQEADIFTWDTVSANKFSAPIKFFSGTNIPSAQGVKQLVNRMSVLYATVGGNHAFYQTNGSTANIIADFSLYSNIRNGQVNANGGEYPIPIYFNSYPSAIAVAGNKILTGTGASPTNNYYPASGVGIFPFGVWSVYFNNDGSTIEQMEYSIPFLGGSYIGSLSSFNTTTDFAAVTTILPLPNGQLAVGWVEQFGGSVVTGNMTIFDNVQYIQDKTLTSLESPMYEIGTALNPTTPQNIEINLIKNLMSGQQIEVSYRTMNNADWTVISTGIFNGDGTKNYYSVQEHGIGATQYIQFRIRAQTGSPNQNSTPEIRNIIVS